MFWILIEDEQQIEEFKHAFLYVPTSELRRGWNLVFTEDEVAKTISYEHLVYSITGLLGAIQKAYPIQSSLGPPSPAECRLP